MSYSSGLFLMSGLIVLLSMSSIAAACQKSTISLPNVKGSAGCLIKMDGFLLAVKTVKSGKWDIPSGKSEEGETADQTAVRETFEETGLKVEAIKLLENFDNEFYVYECRVKEGKPIDLNHKLALPEKAIDEIAEAAFVRIEELTPANTRYPSVLQRICDLFKSLP